ncbi:dTDP-4-dehydrorhamnose reductase [Pseudoclavibacter helvolus]|uniref:dTDP-4-dehydrorhamnose reductase n=1 Tax=Pseudoclavibacter helvolus TaxID=255205 RepID=UPI003C776D68
MTDSTSVPAAAAAPAVAARFLITGASGMLGRDLQRALTGRAVTALDRAALDITDPAAVDAAVAGHDVVINAAAYTNVDGAESDEATAFAVNATGPGVLAAAAAKHGAKLVHVSTDYVFRGDASSPYAEDAGHDPISAYGRTKAAGETAVRDALPDASYIVRTAWLYGADGPNFAKTMARLAASKPEVSVVSDQLGQPTFSADLAKQIVALIDADAPAGTYHGTNSGIASWYDFAREIFRLAGHDPAKVRETDSTAFVRPAPRPAYSVLGHDAWTRANVPPMRPWLDALEDAAAQGVLSS